MPKYINSMLNCDEYPSHYQLAHTHMELIGAFCFEIQSQCMFIVSTQVNQFNPEQKKSICKQRTNSWEAQKNHSYYNP